MSEMEQYYKALERVFNRCDRAVKEIISPRNTLRFLSIPDRKRLLILETWEKRYKVPLEWIIKELCEFYAYREKRWTKKSTAFPVRVVQLTSPQSRLFLEELIEREYPTGENYDLWRSARQSWIMRRRIKEPPRDEFDPEPKFDVLFPQKYNERMAEFRKKEQLLRRQLQKSKPYRDNPFN